MNDMVSRHTTAFASLPPILSPPVRRLDTKKYNLFSEKCCLHLWSIQRSTRAGGGYRRRVRIARGVLTFRVLQCATLAGCSQDSYRDEHIENENADRWQPHTQERDIEVKRLHSIHYTMYFIDLFERGGRGSIMRKRGRGGPLVDSDTHTPD